MRKQLAILLCVGAFGGGCTIISYNRVLPKPAWYWSKEAKAQRADAAWCKKVDSEMLTNSPAK